MLIYGNTKKALKYTSRSQSVTYYSQGSAFSAWLKINCSWIRPDNASQVVSVL